jgi:hypothetical protein
MAKSNSTRRQARPSQSHSTPLHRKGDPKALSAVAHQIALEVFGDACNRVFRAAAVWTPNGTIEGTVDLYLAAMRKQLEWHERSWAAQQARP